MADDRMLREMTSDPKFRKVLVTDGKTAVGPGHRAGAGQGRRRHRLGRPCRALEEVRRPRRHHRAPAGHAGAARPDRRPLGERAGRRDRRQGRHRGQQRRGAPQLRHRQRAAAPTSPRPRWTSTTSACCASRRSSGRRSRARAADGVTQRDGVGQPAVDLRARQLSAARHLLRIEGRGAFAGAVPARRDAAGRHPRGQRVPRADRRRVEPAHAAAQAGARRAGQRDRRRRCATASRTSTPATWRRNGWSAGATTPRCWNANLRRRMS